jgi:hypothetical protein
MTKSSKAAGPWETWDLTRVRIRRLEGVGRTRESQMVGFQVMVVVWGMEKAPGRI